MTPARFAVMRRFDIVDPDGGLYLTRWRVIQTPWGSLYVHRIARPDWRPVLHDHPWSFVSFILRGGYTEVRFDPIALRLTTRRVRRLNVVRRHDAHYITALDRTPTWSVLLVGARRRHWGYLSFDMAGHTITDTYRWHRWELGQ